MSDEIFDDPTVDEIVGEEKQKTEKSNPEVRPFFTIKIFGNNCLVNVKQGGAETVKSVKLESLIKAFQNSETKIESPILPMNCIKYQEHGSTISVILHHPPKIFTAICLGETFENCIRPGIIIKYSLGWRDDGNYGKVYSIQDSKCFGVTDDAGLFSGRTQLYGLPFPNISSEGWVCWGSNSFGGETRSLTGLSVYIDRIFNSPFNNHIFHNGLLKVHGINDPKDLFKYIQGKTKFPNEILENLGRNWTLGTL